MIVRRRFFPKIRAHSRKGAISEDFWEKDAPKKLILSRNTYLNSYDRREFLSRAIELSLQLDPDQEAFTETKAFLSRISNPLLYSHCFFLVAIKELQQNRHDVEKCQKVVREADLVQLEMSIDFIEIVACFDWRRAWDLADPFQHPSVRARALAPVFLRAANENLSTFKARVEESDDPMVHFLGWLAIAKREVELGLPSAKASLEMAMAIREEVVQSHHDFMLQRISAVEAHMNIVTALATTRKIQRHSDRLEALLYLAQLIVRE